MVQIHHAHSPPVYFAHIDQDDGGRITTNEPVKMEGNSTTEMEMEYEAAASQGMLLLFRFVVVGWIIDFTII